MSNRYINCGETTKIHLFGGHICIVDSKEVPRIKNLHWHSHWDGYNRYVVTNKTLPSGKRVTIPMHRLLNKTPKGLHTDHVNHNGLDNRKSNLRTASPSQNCTGMVRANKAGYRGVTKRIYSSGAIRSWAQSSKNGAKVYLGMFKSAIKAAKTVDRWNIENHGEFAFLNFPRRKPCR